MIKFDKANIQLWSRLGTCGAYGQAAMEMPNLSDKVVFLTSDLIFYSGLDRFNKKYPGKLFNFGISEQNMVGVAAGFASEGYVPFASTYATFASMRCTDQVRVNMGYMKLNVKLVGLTSGLAVGILGPTHMCIEDISVMRSIPNITIFSPADGLETIKVMLAAAEMDGPVYIRLTGGMPNPIVYEKDYDFEIGKSVTLRDGKDTVVFATGSMVYNALMAAEILVKQGISTRVVNMHTIKPLDTDSIRAALGAKLIVTIEEHSILGGLGGAVAEVLASLPNSPCLHILGIEDLYPHAAEYSYLIEQSGLSPDQLALSIAKRYKEVT